MAQIGKVKVRRRHLKRVAMTVVYGFIAIVTVLGMVAPLLG